MFEVNEVRIKPDTMTSGTRIPGRLGLMELRVTNETEILSLIGTPTAIDLLGDKLKEIAANAMAGMATGYQTIEDAAEGRTGQVTPDLANEQVSRTHLRKVPKSG